MTDSFWGFLHPRAREGGARGPDPGTDAAASDRHWSNEAMQMPINQNGKRTPRRRR